MARSRDTVPATADPTPPEAAGGEIPHNPADNGQPAPPPAKPKKVQLNSAIVQLVARIDRILNKEEPAKRMAVIRFLAEANGLTFVE